MSISYYKALESAIGLVNMPNPEASPSKFIEWSEDICQLLSEIYELDYDAVVLDLQDKLGLLDEEEEDEEDEDEEDEEDED
jgi:hypothetical protein